MSQITLTASMRSNLLSLQQISKQQDQTQLRLASGLKVNSAIDNPSSYYTAQSLSNRANDLSALLDAMGQGVQTIKAATEGIEKAEDLLEQMKAIAEQTESPRVPEKEYFENRVGANGAVVTTADELRAAIDSGKETICVYGNIDLGDISTSGGLQLKENQKLVGVGYYGDYSNGEGFSSLSATASVANKNLIDITKDGNYLISDLNLNYENTAATGTSYAVKVYGNPNINIIANLQNLTINAKFNENNTSGGAAVYVYGRDTVTNFNNNIKLETNGQSASGINSTYSTVNILPKSNITIKTSGQSSHGINCSVSTINIYTESLLNIETNETSNASGIKAYSDSIVNIYANSNVFIKSQSQGMNFSGNVIANIYGNLYIDTTDCAICNNTWSKATTTKIYASAQIYIANTNSYFMNMRDSGQGPNVLAIASGAKLAFEKDGQTKWYEVQEDYYDENTTTTDNYIKASNVATVLNMSGTSSWQTPSDVLAAQAQEDAQKQADFAAAEEKFIANQNLYNSTLSQYDSLISDSWYKGTNLLKGDSLKINFNEDRSSNLQVQGEDISSNKIGLTSAAWENAQDVQSSLTQILSAKNKLRETAGTLGNYYQITTERSNFTDKLIQVLEEGADKLTLADMNEESANMLALQTRQSLATNSLSLASQASQSILKLF